MIDDFLEPGGRRRRSRSSRPSTPTGGTTTFTSMSASSAIPIRRLGGLRCSGFSRSSTPPASCSSSASSLGCHDLIADPSLEGGGLHQSTDRRVPQRPRRLHRPSPQSEMAAPSKPPAVSQRGLEARIRRGPRVVECRHEECVEKVSPIANRVLIFTTDVTSFHGHPSRCAVPKGWPDVRWRSTTSASRRTRWCGPPSIGPDLVTVHIRS